VEFGMAFSNAVRSEADKVNVFAPFNNDIFDLPAMVVPAEFMRETS
jgi:hypothetical protein